MPEFLIHLILIVAGAVLVLGGVLVGGYLIFKGRAAPGDSFLPQSPKGDVFTIPNVDGLPEFPGEEEPTSEEKKVLERTSEFLNRFKG